MSKSFTLTSSTAAIAKYGHGSPQAREAILAIPSDSGQDTTPIWRVDITPRMKAGVEAGQALFASPRITEPPPSTPSLKSSGRNPHSGNR